MTLMTSHTLLYCSHAVLFYFSVSVFLVLAAHNDSDDLLDSVPYAPSLTQIFSSQPAVKMLADRQKFVSVGFTHNPAGLKFNSEQTHLIGKWLERKLQVTSL